VRAKPKGAKCRNLSARSGVIHRYRERRKEDGPKLRRALESLGVNGRGSKAQT